MSSNEHTPLSFLYILQISQGKATKTFPSQLKENLFKNSVRVKGLFSKKAYNDSYMYAISNASEHNVGKKVITNVLGVFNFSKPNTFQLNGTTVTAPINSIPSEIKVIITNENFKRMEDFEGWCWVELVGFPKVNIE